MATKRATRRPAIGADPLDSIVSAPPAERAAEAEAKAESSRPAKIRATFFIPTDLFEEVRDAVVHLSGPPFRLTLASFAESAFRAELERLQKEANRGKPFPKREAQLRAGRPIGS